MEIIGENSLVSAFLKNTGYMENDTILAIVVYGSRVRNTNKFDSDLDVFVISSENYNFKLGMIIEGIKIDCSIFSIHQLYTIAYRQRVANNFYFTSVLTNGIIIKNEEQVLEEFQNYLEELNPLSYKKGLSNQLKMHLSNLFSSFLETKNSYFYFNLLEEIRKAYNFLNNYSYINLTKIYDVFTNKKYYKEAYHMKMPREDFTSIFLRGIVAKKENRLEIINDLLRLIGNWGLEEESEELFCQMRESEIQLELLTFHNKVLKTIALLEKNHPFANYCYFVLLYQLHNFIKKVTGVDIEGVENGEEKEYSFQGKIEHLKELFSMAEKDYHFDYDNYMLKYKM